MTPKAAAKSTKTVSVIPILTIKEQHKADKKNNGIHNTHDTLFATSPILPCNPTPKASKARPATLKMPAGILFKVK